MKKTILPKGALQVCTMIAICLALTNCSKNDGTPNDADNEDPEFRSALTEFTVATANGYAAGTTGGSGSAVTVTTAAAFKSAAESGTSQIITVSGNINLGSNQINVKSNKTIIGANSSAGVIGCLRLSGVSNVIIQNLNISNPSGVGTGDGVEVSGSTRVFIHKCTFSNCKDGSLDVVRAADNVTISWCRFRYPNQTSHNYTNLIGNGDDATGDRGKLHVTMHHNWYDAGCQERMPRVRFGQVHVYNNYYASSSANYCIGVGNESQIKVENNYFLNQSAAWKNYSSSGAQGRINWNSGNVFSGTSIPTWAPNSSVFTPPYGYSLDAGSSVPANVQNGAGNK